MNGSNPPAKVQRVRDAFPGIPHVYRLPTLSKVADPDEEGRWNWLTFLQEHWNFEADKLTPETYTAFLAMVERLRERARQREEVAAERKEVIGVLLQIVGQIAEVCRMHGADAVAGQAAPPLADVDQPGGWHEEPRWQPVAAPGGVEIPMPPENLPVRGYYLNIDPLLAEKDQRVREWFNSAVRAMCHVSAEDRWGEVFKEAREYHEWVIDQDIREMSVDELTFFRISLLENIISEFDLFGFVRRLEYSKADIEEEERRGTTVGIYCEALVSVLGDWRGDMWIAKKEWTKGEKGFKTPTDLFNQMGDLIKKKDVRRQIGRWRNQKTPALGGHHWPSTGGPVKEFIRLADAIADRFIPPSDGQDIDRTG